MNKEKYKDDLREIRDMMSRSSRFISLSGLSGISAGIFGLAGAFAVYRTVYVNQDLQDYGVKILPNESLTNLLIIAFLTLILSIGTGIYFTTRETRKRNQKIWDQQTRRLVINLAIPLFTGGILCLMFLFKGYIGIIAPLTLIFYGLALVNASKYTLHEIRSLGLLEIALGLIGISFIGIGLLLWSIGFGVLHIVYGVIMQMKYRS
jgi:hypothetical protein